LSSILITDIFGQSGSKKIVFVKKKFFCGSLSPFENKQNGFLVVSPKSRLACFE